MQKIHGRLSTGAQEIVFAVTRGCEQFFASILLRRKGSQTTAKVRT
jgi:hypothetical protein